MKDKHVAVLFACLSILALASTISFPLLDKPTDVELFGYDDFEISVGNTDLIDPDGYFEVRLNGELVASGPNALMEGEAVIRNQTLTGGGFNYDCTAIALGNGSAPTDTSTSLASEISGGGLGPATASINQIGSGADDIEWNLTNEFQSTVTTTVNTTAVTCDSGDNSLDYFNGFGFGRDLNVQNQDNVSVEVNYDPD